MWTCVERPWGNRVLCVIFYVVVALLAVLNSKEQTTECQSGLYGVNCTRNCSDRKCLNSRAECNITGACGTEGCIAGWYSSDCIYKCEQNCTKCDQQTGTCTGCTNGTGNILNRCESLCAGSNCMIAMSESCLSEAGCGSTCIVGQVGINCGNSCSSYDIVCEVCTEDRTTCIRNCSTECLSDMCELVEGPCLVGCQKGFFGDTCREQCSPACRNAICDGRTGQCTDGCIRGLNGEYCDINCSSGCYNNECNQKTGFCLKGCKEGYFGDKCDSPCSENCVANQCDKNTSTCLQGCNYGWTGPTCSESVRTPVMALVIAVVVLSFIVIFLLLVIWYLIRYARRMQVRRRKSHFKTNSVAGDDVIEVLERRKSEGDALENDILKFQRRYRNNWKTNDEVFLNDKESKSTKTEENRSHPNNSTEPENEKARELGAPAANVTEKEGQLNNGFKPDEKVTDTHVLNDARVSDTQNRVDDVPDDVIINEDGASDTQNGVDDVPDDVIIECTKL